MNIKDDIKKQWKNSGHSDEKYSKRRKVGYGDLDGFMWDWFTVARSKKCSCQWMHDTGTGDYVREGDRT